MVTHASEEQAALEARAMARWARVEAGELTPEQGMGSMDEWELRLGAHRLALVPSTRQWLFLDPVHGTWEPTGFSAGQAVFGVQDGELGVRRTDGDAPPAAPTPDRTAAVSGDAGRSISPLAWLRGALLVAGLALSAFGAYRTLTADDGPQPVSSATTTPSRPQPAPAHGTGTKTCSNDVAGYTLHYPAEWSAGGEGRCTFFHPSPFEAPEASEVAAAIAVLELPDDFDTSTTQFEQPGIDVDELERFSVDGRRAMRVLYLSPGEAGDGARTYQVLVERVGTTLVFVAYEPYAESFAETREVVDSMVASLEAG